MGIMDEIEEIALYLVEDQPIAKLPRKAVKEKNKIIDGVEMRKCYYCLQYKPLDQYDGMKLFSKTNAEVKMGYQAHCRSCGARLVRQRYQRERRYAQR